MLFLLRPRQTWMPYRRPRPVTQQDVYNRRLQDSFDATRRTTPAVPAAAGIPVQALKDAAALHAAGDLTDAEFAAAKARLLAGT